MKPLIKLKITALLFIPLVLACFALLPGAQAGDAPTPELALPGFNTADGFQALQNVTTGVFNSAFGAKALQADTTGSHNTALGGQALLHNNGSYNTAVGENALVFNTSGSMNMALGQGALANNLAGSSNTAMGFQALNVNTADDNVAVGFQALRSNTIGNVNTAIGFQALLSNTDGNFNTAVGNGALAFNISGQENTALGFGALGNHAPGNFNTAVGSIALLNTTGEENTGVGVNVLDNNTSGGLNTAVGFGALEASHGSHNTALGVNAGLNVTTADGVIAIGSLGGNTDNTCWIGNIFGKTTVSATTMPVIVSNTGQLGTVVSSRRFKEAIKPMDKASETILGLKPVTFHYKSDGTNTPQFGLVAEDVAEVNPDLVVRDDKGEIYSVRYDAVNAMLLNEFLKEHHMVQEQQKEIDALKAELKEQRALIQKVNDKVELGKPAPRTVLNSQ
jgi:hypothetical protein